MKRNSNWPDYNREEESHPMIKFNSVIVATAALVAASCAQSSPAFSFGDYPIASCKSWNGTIRKTRGQDSQHAAMAGVITVDDFREYCQRDPGGETTEYGGKLTVDECVQKYEAEMKDKRVRSIADCQRGTIIFQYNGGTSSAQFPLAPDTDNSCASGMPPLQSQFRILCPTNAARWNIQ